MGSQLLQNTEIIKQTDVLLWKIKRIYGSVSYLFSRKPVSISKQKSFVYRLNFPGRFWHRLIGNPDRGAGSVGRQMMKPFLSVDDAQNGPQGRR